MRTSEWLFVGMFLQMTHKYTTSLEQFAIDVAVEGLFLDVSANCSSNASWLVK